MASTVIAGVEVTEEEPDDDFCPAIDSGAKSHGDAVTADADKIVEETVRNTAQAEANVEPEIESAPEQPTLEGNWHQLQGVPRPQKIVSAHLLAWSDQGHVAVFPEQGRVEVQYAVAVTSSSTDTSGQLSQRISDSIGLNMASLSSKACCLAASAGAEGGSQLLIRPAERWDKAVFSAPLSHADEAVEAIACGESFAAALTSKRMLRLYGLSGLPLSLLSTSGRSVALAAHKSFLLVVVGSPGTRAPEEGEDDPLEYRLLDVSSRTQRAAGRLPLSPQARLRWLGFSDEAIPMTIDSNGTARALLGSGPGAWGPAGGSGGEWTIVLQLQSEESRVGPLWAVRAQAGVLFCAEVGSESLEPQPLTAPGKPGNLEASNGEQGLTAEVRRFGHGTLLREFTWDLGLGPVVACGNLAEATLREQLLTRHMEEMASASVLSQVERDQAAALAKSWRSKGFGLYGKLVKAGEVERALDVARHFIAVGGASKPLSFAQDFAERAGCYRLADEVAALPRVSSDAPRLQTESHVTARPEVHATAVPKVVPRELPPLFESGEGEAAGKGVSSDSRRASDVESGSSRDPTPNLSSATSTLAAPDHSPPIVEKMPGSVVVKGAAAHQSSHSAGSSVPTGQLSLPAATAAATTNPFARRQKQASVQAPHLLRDALGTGIRRLPSAQLAGVAGNPAPEPPAKVARVA